MKLRRCLLFLFRQSAVSPLTYPRLVRLLNPNFSEVGSNRRMLEEKAYRYLLKYMKEVAGKSREKVFNTIILFELQFNSCDYAEVTVYFHEANMFFFPICLYSWKTRFYKTGGHSKVCYLQRERACSALWSVAQNRICLR